MSEASAALPDDVESLKSLVLGRDETIAKLLAEIARLRRWRFGRSAEHMDATLVQLQLALDDLLLAANPPLPQAEAVPVEESTQIASSPCVMRLPRVPRALPAHLPREIIVHAPSSCTCPDCGAAMRKIGVGPGQSLLVNGVSGTLGLCAALIALAMGATKILGTGRNGALLERVKTLARSGSPPSPCRTGRRRCILRTAGPIGRLGESSNR